MRAFSSLTFLVSVLFQGSLAGQGVTFEDVTVAAGVDYLHWSPDPDNGPWFCKAMARMSGA